MPQATQQTSTPPSDLSANDLAAQIRAQVNQQLKQAGVSDQAAKSAADRAAQAAQGVTINKNGKITRISTQNGQTVDHPRRPGAPVAPLAPARTARPGRRRNRHHPFPSDPPLDIPPRVENLGYGLMLMIAVIAVGKPLARALGSVIERRALKPAMPADFGARLERIEQGIESVSIEVERISESQRYILKVQTPERVEIPRSAG